MSFPTSPTNGQQAIVNGIVYNYNSTKDAWIKNVTTAGTLTTGNVIITSTVQSTSINNGALIVTGGIGTQGNINAGGTIIENTKRVATMSKAIAMSIVFGG